MAIRRLTTKFVEAITPTKGRQAAYPDQQIPGLELRVSPQGRKTWSFRYRAKSGVQRRMTLGTFPSVDVGDARDAALAALSDIAKGKDPAADQRAERASLRNRSVRTFNDLCEEYLAACEKGRWRPKGKTKRASTIKEERGTLKRHAQPTLGRRDLAEITRRDVRQLLAKMKDRGINARTNKTHAIIRQVFAYGIAEELLTVNPAVGFAPLADQKPRTRILTDGELKALWSALVDPSGLKTPEDKKVTVGRPMRIALQLALLLLQRRGEVAGMMLSELDLDAGLWLIPGERMKSGRPHLVPLPPRAVELIREALTLADDVRKARAPRRNEPLAMVFPGGRGIDKPMRPDSATHAMNDLTEALGIKGVSPHDLRRTGSTALTSERLGVSPFIRSQVLGHASDTGGGSAVSMLHYDSNDYIREKRRALEAWEGLLLNITEGRERPDNVRQLVGGTI